MIKAAKDVNEFVEVRLRRISIERSIYPPTRVSLDSRKITSRSSGTGILEIEYPEPFFMKQISLLFPYTCVNEATVS